MLEKKGCFLVLNAGSSSLRYALFDQHKKELLRGHVDGIGKERCLLRITKRGVETHQHFQAKDHLHAVMRAVKSLEHEHVIASLDAIIKVGHRVVHGGEYFTEPTLINDAVLKKIKSLSVLAPLHNPPAIAGILAIRKVMPKAEQVAVFDTSFHHTIPKEAFLYGIPYEMYEEHGIRKYGFHGISHGYVSGLARKLLAGHKKGGMITCHLGNGSSITAVKDGKSIDTSMGFTPLDGLIMGTRSGELDPEILLYLMRQQHYTPAQLEELLNNKSGLKGISGDSDIRDLRARSLKHDEKAILALNMLSYRIAKYIGSYAAALHGLDAIVFTGGIGEHAYYIRKKVCAYLQHLGVSLDADANRKNETFVNDKKSRVQVLVLRTDEAQAIVERL